MEKDHLLPPGEDDLRNIALASASFKGYCVPTSKRHKQKAKIGFRPTGMLLRINADDPEAPRAYLDDNQRKWYERKSCCSCKPNRLVCYDAPLIPNSPGASEMSFVVMDDGAFNFHAATYYYRDRDKSTCCQHFWADIFPIFCYCHCGARELIDNFELASTEETQGD